MGCLDEVTVRTRTQPLSPIAQGTSSINRWYLVLLRLTHRASSTLRTLIRSKVLLEIIPARPSTNSPRALGVGGLAVLLFDGGLSQITLGGLLTRWHACPVVCGGVRATTRGVFAVAGGGLRVGVAIALQGADGNIIR